MVRKSDLILSVLEIYMKEWNDLTCFYKIFCLLHGEWRKAGKGKVNNSEPITINWAGVGGGMEQNANNGGREN